MFWKNFSYLCSKNGVSPNAVAKALNLSSGSVTFWKNGKTPHHPTLLKIADYFNVSVDYLLTGENASSIDQQLEDEDFALWGEVKELTTEEKTDVLNFINFIKSKRK